MSQEGEEKKETHSAECLFVYIHLCTSVYALFHFPDLLQVSQRVLCPQSSLQEFKQVAQAKSPSLHANSVDEKVHEPGGSSQHVSFPWVFEEMGEKRRSESHTSSWRCKMQ